MMSVINQMLKDLEQRTPEHEQVAMPVAVSHKPSTIKIVLISLVVLISLNLIGFYIWNLQEKLASSELKVNKAEQSSVANKANELPQQTLTKSIKKVLKEPTPETTLITESKVVQEITLPQKAVIEKPVKLSVQKPKAIIATKKQVQEKVTTPESITPVLAAVQPFKPAKTAVPTESKMSVSRRHLTSEELVAQKLVRAEKALKLNDIIKTEQLFEEVLIIDPHHKQARKKLAALWFGRKSYQQATNLLAQGISLDKNDAELRLLKARIHLQQGQLKAAYNTLKALPTIEQQEYQVMLANVSQQIEQYESAIQAYKVLIDMQAYSGRWHLGLAIVYDKNSQFSLAVTEYAIALTKSDLSVASAEFAQQRMQALGE